jgi:cysteine desulfuration protein SufE
MTLGPEVQTLTRAMTSILCKGLDGATPRNPGSSEHFVTRIVGAELVVRSQTTTTFSPGLRAFAVFTWNRNGLAGF